MWLAGHKGVCSVALQGLHRGQDRSEDLKLPGLFLPGWRLFPRPTARSFWLPCAASTGTRRTCPSILVQVQGSHAQPPVGWWWPSPWNTSDWRGAVFLSACFGEAVGPQHVLPLPAASVQPRRLALSSVRADKVSPQLPFAFDIDQSSALARIAEALEDTTCLLRHLERGETGLEAGRTPARRPGGNSLVPSGFDAGLSDRRHGPSPPGSFSLLGHHVPSWVFTWIFPSSPVLSILLATLTVFPQMSY